jgi:chaperonin GroES
MIEHSFLQLQANTIKKLIPLLDRVLVQRAEALTKTAGGIVIPEKAQSKVLQATVIAVGPGARNQVIDIIIVNYKKTFYY